MYSIKQKLKQILENDLPGLPAQLRMVPEIAARQRLEAQKMAIPKESSVLILFYPAGNTFNTVFIQRHEYAGVHSNQVAFPGGKSDPDDQDMYYTALREANEELGILPEKVTILGKLTDLYVPPSNYMIHPIVAFTDNKPIFLADKKEVREYFEVSISELIDHEAFTHKTIKFANGFEYHTPCFIWKNYIVWGATAMIVSELIELLKKIDKSCYFLENLNTKQEI